MSLFDKLQNIGNTTIMKTNCNRALSNFNLAKRTQPFEYEFCAENAYSYIVKQVSFGPRVPGSHASLLCKEWIVGKLKEFGVANITEQHSQQVAYNGNNFEAINISAQINPDVQNRIMLLSHWDSRPWADHDSIPSNRDKAIDGANDGASGVSVILELARIISHNQSKRGIDILFVDAEDCGPRQDEAIDTYNENSWCLGTQYWIRHPTLNLSNIDFIILLDMVGGNDAIFPLDYFSQCTASCINNIVWQAAHQAGHYLRFQDKIGKAIIDDHVYFILNYIPTVAIIESNHPDTGFFCPTWHTRDDTIDNIDIKTLKVVGETLERLLL